MHPAVGVRDLITDPAELWKRIRRGRDPGELVDEEQAWNRDYSPTHHLPLPLDLLDSTFDGPGLEPPFVSTRVAEQMSSTEDVTGLSIARYRC